MTPYSSSSRVQPLWGMGLDHVHHIRGYQQIRIFHKWVTRTHLWQSINLSCLQCFTVVATRKSLPATYPQLLIGDTADPFLEHVSAEYAWLNLAWISALITSTRALIAEKDAGENEQRSITRLVESVLFFHHTLLLVEFRQVKSSQVK